MVRRKVDWQQLKDRTFQTSTGARFTVVKVTAKSVIIRPEGGVRNYDLSIQNELERGLVAFEAGRFFPSPTDWLKVGVRAVRTSYVWGVLHALLVQNVLSGPPNASRANKLGGRWRISELSDLDESYFEESDEPPVISIHSTTHGDIHGEYHFGLSNGTLNGQVRAFGGEALLLFSYEGADEMDSVNGAGWAQLNGPDRLEGEFLDVYGRFVATREVATLHRVGPKRSRKK